MGEPRDGRETRQSKIKSIREHGLIQVMGQTLHKKRKININKFLSRDEINLPISDSIKLDLRHVSKFNSLKKF